MTKLKLLIAATMLLCSCASPLQRVLTNEDWFNIVGEKYTMLHVPIPDTFPATIVRDTITWTTSNTDTSYIKGDTVIITKTNTAYKTITNTVKVQDTKYANELKAKIFAYEQAQTRIYAKVDILEAEKKSIISERKAFALKMYLALCSLIAIILGYIIFKISKYI